MASPAQRSPAIRFGAFQLDAANGELCKAGVPVKIHPQPLRVLLLLLEQPGKVVTREEIQSCLWGNNTFVDFDRGINFCVNQIRGALGDDAEKPQYVETLPRRGYRFIGPVETVAERPSALQERDTPTPKVGPVKYMSLKIVAGAFCAVVIILTGLAVWRMTGRSSSVVRIQSLAVLPLENLSGDPSQDYFADGMTDELITQFGQIENVRVISRTSVMHYKGVHRPLPQIAHELNVDVIVEGTVLCFGDQVRITAQLVQASPEKHLWAQSYQRDLRGVLNLQDEIARAVAQQVQGTLNLPGQTSSKKQHSVIPAAYEAYWKGEYFLDKITPESLQKAADYFQEAIEKDPEYAAAYNKLAASYRIRGNIGALPIKESYSKAAQLTEKALEVDPLSGSAHAGRGWGALLYDLDFPTAGSEFKRAVELNPNGVEGHEGLAVYYAAVRRLDQAVPEMARAREVDPLSFIVNNDVCRILYFARRFDEALAQCKANLDMDPELRRSLWRMGSIYAAMGEEKEAASTFIQAFQNAGAKPATLTALTKGAQESGLHGMWEAALHLINQDDEKQDPFGTATAYIYAGNKEKALTLLDRAYQQRCFGITWLAVDPTYDSLRSDPRFQILVGQMRIPQ